MPTEQNKLWDDYGAPFLDLRILLNNKRSGLLDNTMHANCIAENTARMILSKETIDFSTEGEDFFNYVWDRFGFDVYRAMLGIVKEQLPTSVLVNILDNFMLRMTILQGQTHSTQGQFPQQPAVRQQFFMQTFFPQLSISPSSVMGSSNNNNGYRGRPNTSPFYQNYYPYVRNTVACRRRRSHLDDIYLPNYEDDDLEEKNGFNQERFRYRRPYWYSNNPPQRSDHRNSSNRTLSFVKRSKETNNTYNSKSKTNDLNLNDNATSSTSATSDSSAKNCDKKKCEAVNVTEVNGNLLTNELQSESKTSISDKVDHSISTSNLNDCANNAPSCHNSENNLKTEDISANSYSSDIANKSSSVSPNGAPDKMNTTEELQILELLNNFHGKPNSSDKDDKASEICDSAIENPFSLLKNMDSDEEIDCFGDFITIDKIDTAKSYLKTSSIVLDDYKVIDMDISPLKRKNECDEEEETTKKAKHDSLYFNINSGKLLNEINKVLKENKQSFEISKRFRSKSLTLNDTRENSPIVRSSSMDSIDKSDVQVSYNFDLKTNLLLLLKPKPTCKETSSSVNDILKVLEDGDEKLTVDKFASLQNESSISNNNSSESTSANIDIGNDGSTQEIKENYTEGKNFETFIEPGENESKPVTDDIKADHDRQVSTTNNSDEKGDTEENVKAVPNAETTIKNESCTNSKIEESNDLSTPKRKSSIDREEQSKKICLDSIAENIVQASYTNDNTENEIAIKKEKSTDHTTSLTKSDLEETNQNNVEPAPLPNKTVFKESCGESLIDIEEELKSLLGEDSLNNHQQKLRTSHKEHVENKDQNGVTSNKKIAADAVNADDKDSNKKSLKINSCNDTTYTESSSVETSNLTQEGSNPRKSSEKGTRQSTQKLNPHKQREKQIRNESSSSPIQSKPKDKLIRKQSPADKKQKSNETHSKNGNCADVATPNVTPQPCVNKSLSHEPGEKQIAPGSKTISYYQRFKRIQSLFGSDSESEMEEESLVNAKTIHNVSDNNKNSVSRKIYEESNKREIQMQKQEVIGLRTNFNKQISDGSMEPQKSVNLAEYYINKYIKNVPTSHSLKESSKVIEKRRCSVPITDATLKFLEGAAKAQNATINKPKRIEKKRRETLPASLNGGISKECKPHQGKNDQVEKGVCVINHKLKDPRKEHHKYKSLETSEQKSENNSIKKYPTVKWDPNKIQNKVCEKKYKNEKKNIFCKTSVPKINSESKKKQVYEKSQVNKSKNQKEKDCTSKKERTSDTIINQLQLKSKLSKTDQSKTIVSDPKELEASKIRKKLELTLKTGTEQPVHLQLVQCSTLPRDRFPMLQRANSRIEENDCCDKAVVLENVDVNKKIDVVKQVIDQEDDVIEVREDIPIIDLTNDPVKEKPDDSLKVEVDALSHDISCKTNEMITLYRSEETVDSSLDIQPTSETVSPTALKSKRSRDDKSNTIEGFTSGKSQNADNRNENFINASPTLYISPLSNNTANVSSPARLKFNLIAGSNNKTQNSNRSPSSNFASPPPTMPQTVKPSEVLTDTQNVHAVRRNNFQSGVTHESGGNFVEITSQVNLPPQTLAEQRQESLVNQPTRISFNTQNNCQQNSFPPSNALAQLQQKVDSLHKTTNNSASISQNPLLYQMINSDNVPGKNAYATHSPMRHLEEEGPAPMHEISMQEIRNAGIVLLKYLLLYDSMKRAQWVYKNELLKIQKNLPTIIRLEIYQFESFSSEKDKKLYKDLIKELKSLNLTGRSSNVKSAQVLMEHVFNALRRKIDNLTLWRVYLMLDTVMQPEISEYMTVPFLRDLFSYVSFVAGKIRSTLPGAPQSVTTQITSPPQDPFTPNQRKMLEWQIKQYISIQKRLTEELQSNVSNRLPNSGMGIAQDIQQLPNYASRLIIMASNQQSANKVNPNLTVHQNIIIRPVDVTKLNGPSASNTYKNKDTCTFNDTFKIRLPYTAPYENSPQSTNASLQEQKLSHSVEAINSQANSQVSVNTQPSPITPQATIESSPTTNNCGSPDPVALATSPQQVESDNVVVKQEKEAPLLTDQEIETIDLTWINDIDPKQLQSEMEFIAVKKEEPPDEEEIEVELNEEPFAVAPSPADSGISSPPIQVEYDESVFSNRSCICDKVAEYVCGCMMAMYCSVECQLEDWKSHKDICQKYKSKTNKPQQ